MRDRHLRSEWRPVAVSLVALAIGAGSAWGQQSSTSSSKDQSHKDQPKNSEPVVRSFGSEGGYHTEVTTQVNGKDLTEDEWRQASLLVAQVFQHLDRAQDELDADDGKGALKEVNRAREAIRAIRTMLPKATLRTRTIAPDGKAIYEDETEIQQSRIPVFEGMLHAQTLAPILAARRNALEVAGVHVVESETIVTEAVADIDRIDGQLARAARALEQNKSDTAANALAQALVRGVEFRFRKDDKELASARDAIWLARRSLEENNPVQALANLEVARQRLALYREVVSTEERPQVDEMLREVAQLEVQLRSEGTRAATRGERARQNHQLTQWWDKVNGWFRRHF